METDAIQLELNFDAPLETEDKTSSSNCPNHSRTYQSMIPDFSKYEPTDMLEKMDIAFQQLGTLSLRGMTPLVKFIIRSFYVEGMSVTDMYNQIKQGVEGIKPLTKERIRVLTFDICDELLHPSFKNIHVKRSLIKPEFVEAINLYAQSKIGEIVTNKQVAESSRLQAIAFMLKKRIAKGDTVIHWIQNQPIMFDMNIEKRLFNASYQSLVYCLQEEVRPMSLDMILTKVSQHPSMKGQTINKNLICLLLTHQETFETLTNENGDTSYQLRYEHLNVTQKLARIIYEHKEITPAEIAEEYKRRGDRKHFSSMTTTKTKYPWCVLVGKSKWVYAPDSEINRKPMDVIKDYCYEHKRFTFDEITAYLTAEGYMIKPGSVRCYIMKHCRRRNDDKNSFCLTSEVPEEENHLWFSKQQQTTRNREKKWLSPVLEKLHELLVNEPNKMILQRKAFQQCVSIFEANGISPNNFYKSLHTISWLELITIDSKTYLKLK
jgi:hypothetical protein